MANTALSIPQADIEAIEQFYTLREGDKVLEFLDKHEFLVPVLLKAPEKIRHYFPDSQLFLEVVPDPEIINWVQLVLSICMNLDPDEAVDRQNQLDLDWWVGVSDQVQEHLFTLLEYP